MINLKSTKNDILFGQDIDAIISRAHGLRSEAIAQTLEKITKSRSSK